MFEGAAGRIRSLAVPALVVSGSGRRCTADIGGKWRGSEAAPRRAAFVPLLVQRRGSGRAYLGWAALADSRHASCVWRLCSISMGERVDSREGPACMPSLADAGFEKPALGHAPSRMGGGEKKNEPGFSPALWRA